MTEKKHLKLVTRSDMDGLVCAVMLKKLDMIDDILFVHPKDVQDGKVNLTGEHITTNLPYHPAVHLAFDHHSSEIERIHKPEPNQIIDPDAPSTARVVYNYFGGKERFPDLPEDLLAAVDKADSAQYTLEDVLHPQGWELLSFLMDARTGLGRFRDFTVSNYTLMMNLIDYCQYHTIDQILNLPDVKERVALFFEHQQKHQEQIQRCSTVIDNLVVYDLRDEETIYAGNRFTIYALYPQVNVSMYIMWGLKKQNTVFALGRSIFNRTCEIDLGDLALEFGGGGHEAAATCQVANERAEESKQALIKRLTGK